MKIMDDPPLVYREGFPLDELVAVIFFLSTDPDADPARTEYAASTAHRAERVRLQNDYEFFNYIDAAMVADTMGWDTQGEYGDELVSTTMRLPITQIEAASSGRAAALHQPEQDAIAQARSAGGHDRWPDSPCWMWTFALPGIPQLGCISSELDVATVPPTCTTWMRTRASGRP